MNKNNVWIANVAAPVMIMVLLLFAGSRNVKAADQPAAANAEVKIDNFVFGPQTISVPAFKSKVRDTDEKFSYKFDKAGTYSYFCSVHPKMTGKVVVQ